MTRRPAKTYLTENPEPRSATEPRAIAEGRGVRMTRASALAIANASTAAGFDVPPQVQAVLDAPEARTEDTAATAPATAADPTEKEG